MWRDEWSEHEPHKTKCWRRIEWVHREWNKIKIIARVRSVLANTRVGLLSWQMKYWKSMRYFGRWSQGFFFFLPHRAMVSKSTSLSVFRTQRVSEIKYSLSLWNGVCVILRIQVKCSVRARAHSRRAQLSDARHSYKPKAARTKYSNELNNNAFAFVINKSYWDVVHIFGESGVRHTECTLSIFSWILSTRHNQKYWAKWVIRDAWNMWMEWITSKNPVNLCRCGAYCQNARQIWAHYLLIFRSVSIEYHVKLWHFIGTQVGEWWPKAK